MTSAAEPARSCSDCGTGLRELQPDRTGDLICIACHMRRHPAPRLEAVEDPPPSLPTSRDQGGREAPQGRYDGRLVDLALVDVDAAIPWRVEGLLVDGYLTTLAAHAGHGKTWLALALAAAVHRGEPMAGMTCRQGRALLFDAESGAKLVKRRLRAAGTADDAFALVDVDGLSLANEADLKWMQGRVTAEGANLVVIDSLARTTPGKDENSNTDMGPVVAGLARMARQTDAAVLLLHHRGKGEGSASYRGATAILDQSDAVFVLNRPDADEPLHTLRVPSDGKFRPDENPPPRAFTREKMAGQVVHREAGYEVLEPAKQNPARDALLAHLPATPTKRPDWIRAAGLKNQSNVHEACKQLADDGFVQRVGDLWVRPDWTPPDALGVIA